MMADDQLVTIAPGLAETHPVRFLKRRRRVERTLAVGVPIVLIALWELAARRAWIDVRFFPAPSTVWTTAVELVRSGDLQDDLLISMRRVLIGFTCGVLTGCVAGYVMATFRLVRAGLDPLLSALYTVPKLALLPLLLLIFGAGEAPKLILISLTVFFFMWIGTMAAAMSVGEAYHEVMQSFRAGRWQTFRHVVLPASLPQVFVSMRISAGVSILVLVGAEFVQGNDGLGYLIWNSWSLFIARRMYVGVVVVAVLGYLFGVLVRAIGRRLLPWAPEVRADG